MSRSAAFAPQRATEGSPPFASFIPRFDDELEDRFVADSTPERLSELVMNGWIATFLFQILIAADYFLAADVFTLSLILRFTAALITAITLWSMTRHRTWWLASPYAWIELTILLQCLLLAGITATILACTHNRLAYLLHAAYVLVIIFGTVMYRLRFAYALLLVTAVLFIDIFGLALSPEIPARVLGALLLLSTAVAGYGLAGNRAMEVQERRRYLLSMQLFAQDRRQGL